ncbi:MAG: hypothetical protein ACRDL7_14925, partial [Gaiellaceae bacterium]
AYTAVTAGVRTEPAKNLANLLKKYAAPTSKSLYMTHSQNNSQSTYLFKKRKEIRRQCICSCTQRRRINDNIIITHHKAHSN